MRQPEAAPKAKRRQVKVSCEACKKAAKACDEGRPCKQCVPRRSSEDDVYKGMFIPKGTVVIANSYGILRDETIYKDPDTFNSDRYLPNPKGNAEPEPVGHFGFGRRICVGRYLADASIFIAIASILATLNIRRAKDDNGNEIVPPLELMTGLTSRPKPFRCEIELRDKSAEKMIRQIELWDEI